MEEYMDRVLRKWDKIIQAIMDNNNMSKEEYETWFQSLEIENVVFNYPKYDIYLKTFCESACQYLDSEYRYFIMWRLQEFVDNREWDIHFVWHEEDEKFGVTSKEQTDCLLNEKEGFISDTELLQSGVNDYITESNKYLEEISSLFSEEHLLEKDELSNRDVVHQFKEAKNMLDLFLNRSIGKSLSSIGDYIDKVHIGFDSKEFKNIEDDVHNSYTFLNACVSEIDKSIGILEAGIYGEDILYNRLKILGNKVRILRNVRYVIDDDFSVEHDMIIISPVGIFTIEIKNWKNDSVVDKNGFLVSDERRVNLVEQVMRHTHNLEQVLKEKLGRIYNVYPIVVWVNLNAKIRNYFPKIQVCNYNNVEFELFNTEKYNDNYDRNDMEIIYQCLHEVASPCDVYSYGFTRQELLEAVAKIVAGVKWFPVACKLEEQIPIIRQNDLEYRTVDNVVFPTQQEARLAEKELPEIIKFFRKIPCPTWEDGATLKYEKILEEKKQEFDTMFHSEELKKKYIRQFDALQELFYQKFCVPNRFLGRKGKKESAQIKALRYVKEGKITTGQELLNRSIGLLSYLPEIGLEQSEAKEAFEYLKKIQMKLQKKGKL